MKQFGYKGSGPIGVNNKDFHELIEAIGRHTSDTIGLGFKKIPFHLGINKFVPELDNLLELEYPFVTKTLIESFAYNDYISKIFKTLICCKFPSHDLL